MKLKENMQESQNQKMTYEHLMRISKLKEQQLSKTLDTFQVQKVQLAFRTIKAYLDNPEGGIYLWGKVGVGKSHLACGLALELIKLGKVVEFYSVPELLLDLRACSESKKEADLINEVSNKPYLFLDDLGAEKPSDWVLQSLYLIIDRRERLGKRNLIVTSNYSLAEISRRLHDRLASRIAGMCKVVEMKGQDWRLKR